MINFNYQKLWKRLLTIILYSPIVMLAVFLGDIPYFMMIFLVAFISILELYHMYSAKYKTIADPFNVAFVFVAISLTCAFMKEFSFVWKNYLLIASAILGIFYFNFELVCKKIFFAKSAPFYVLRVIFYVGIMFPFMILLRNIPQGLEYIVFLVSVVWTNDIFAYLIGLPLGRHKLSPEISPKKSIEGAIGAALGAILMSVNLRILINAVVWQAIIVGLAISILAQTGDLIESLLKREFEIKDSGNIFPGHGGILDRLDSFILTVPVFYLVVNYVLK